MDNIYLCKPSKEIMYALNGIVEDSVELTVNLNNSNTLSFDYNKYIVFDGEETETNGYDVLEKNMLLFYPTVGYFILDTPSETFSDTVSKSISATSIDCELANKWLVDFKINCGTTDSQEYLITYDDGETEELLNAHTKLPYDYITVKCTLDDELRKVKQNYLSNVYTNANSNYVKQEQLESVWQLSKLIPRLVSKVITHTDENDVKSYSIEEFMKLSYNQDGSIHSIELINGKFLQRVETLISFYSKYKHKLSLLDIVLEQTHGRWTVGIIDEKYYNKKCKFDINGTSIYDFVTQDIAKGLEGIIDFDTANLKLNFTSVEKIGNDTGIYISYETVQNSLDVTCDENSIVTRFIVSGEDLTVKEVNYGEKRIENLDYFMNKRDKLGNRVYVSDSLANKYASYMQYRDSHRQEYINASKEIADIQERISEETYRVPNDLLYTDWETYTKEELEDTLDAYQIQLNTIITMYKTDYGTAGCNSDGSVNETYMKNTIYWNDYYSYTQLIIQVSKALNDGNFGDKDAMEFETNWELYGSAELENKIDAYNIRLGVFEEDKTIVFDGNGTPIPYGNLAADVASKYTQGTYTVALEEYNKLLAEKTSCASQLEIVKNRISNLSNALKQKQVTQTEIANNVRIDTYSVNGGFSKDELAIIYSLYIDAEYENSNIVKTSLDTVSSTFDRELELLEVAKEQLSIESQPQYQFTSSMDNILQMSEYEPIIKDFNVGNFIYVEHTKGSYVKMRLVSYSHNPMIAENSISATFSNVLKSYSKRNDFTYLLNNANGSSGASGSSSGSGGSGTVFGDNIDYTLSNTMLSHLLNSETFGTKITNVVLDTVNTNKMSAKYATFGGLATGTTKVDGSCITTGVINSNKKDPITGNPYTSIRVDDGTFYLANGKLTFDGSDLSIAQAVNSGSINIGNGNFIVDENGNMLSKSANITGSITTTNGSIGGWNITENGIFSSNGKTHIYKDGNIYIEDESDSKKYAKLYNGYIETQGLDNNLYKMARIQDGSLHCTRGDNSTIKNRTTITSDVIHMCVGDSENDVKFHANIAEDEYYNMFSKGYISGDVEFWKTPKINGITVSTTDHHHSALWITPVGGGDKFMAVSMVNRVNSTDNYALRPTVEAIDSGYKMYLGSDECRWDGIYLYTHVNVFSDRNGKKDFSPFDSRYEEMYMNLKPTTYRMKDGTSGRIHSGFISQEVEEAMTNNDLTDMDFAAFCKDTDENGNDTYSLRYEEFIALNTHMIQKLYKKIETLEEEIAELKKQNS